MKEQPHQPPPGVARELRRLVEQRRRTSSAERDALERLHAAVYRAHQDGASDRGIAAAIGVSANTVRAWRQAGERAAG